VLQLGDDRRVAQGGDVTELTAVRDVAQQSAHDLPGPGLGQVLNPDDPARPGQLADLTADVLAERRLQVRLGRHARAESDVGDDGLAGQVVIHRDDRSLGYRRVRDERRFDLGRGQPVAGNVDDVVHPPGDPEVAIVVSPRAVTGEIGAGAEPAEIRLHVPIRILIQGPEHARPRPGQREQAAALSDLVSRLVDQRRRNAG
jgi:hypothetical protein